MDSKETVNNLLVGLFDEIVDLEEKALIRDEFNDISKNDMHIIEAIGNLEKKNMSTLANKLKVTVGTLTIAINNLVKKGYVERLRSKEDKRVVLVTLCEKGERAYTRHREFHQQMVSSILSGLDNKESEVLISTLEKVHTFIEQFQLK